MRKIEMNMNAAIMLGRDWKQANTETFHWYRLHDDGSESEAIDVFLHGHHIATVWGICNGVETPRDQWTVEVNTNTLRAWPTRTTMSRLRALGVDVCARKGEVLLNGETIL